MCQIPAKELFPDVRHLRKVTTRVILVKQHLVVVSIEVNLPCADEIGIPRRTLYRRQNKVG